MSAKQIVDVETGIVQSEPPDSQVILASHPKRSRRGIIVVALLAALAVGGSL